MYAWVKNLQMTRQMKLQKKIWLSFITQKTLISSNELSTGLSLNEIYSNAFPELKNIKLENAENLLIGHTTGITTSQSCSVKKVLFKILQNSQQSTCARVYFLIKLQASGLQLY